LAKGKTILVLGGGVGGLVTASRLRNKLPRRHRIVLIEREAQFIFQPSLLWLIVGQRSSEQISRPLSVLERKGIELVRGNIDHIDPENRTVRVGESSMLPTTWSLLSVRILRLRQSLVLLRQDTTSIA